jgi:hypothetical protein
VLTVYTLIYAFIIWYIDRENGKVVFVAIILAFMGGMMIFLTGEMIGLVVG